MSGLRSWFRQKVTHKKLQNDRDKSLPVLPLDRRPISSSQSTQFTSPFFHLPLEIRQTIYTYAFGDRVIYIDLKYQSLRAKRPFHDEDAVKRLAENRPSGVAWRWWSNPCYRAPWSTEIRFWEENKIGSSWCCENRKRPEKSIDCIVGIMGWLLSCRQAYSEAVAIFYSKNTIFTTSLVFIKSTSTLLPRECLVNITSLEFIWDIERWPGNYSNEAERLHRWETYQKLMSSVGTSTYPNLKKLFIIVQNLTDYVPSNPPGRLVRASTNETLAATLLNQPNRIVKDYNGQLQKFIVTYESHLFRRLAETVEHLGLQDVNSEDGEDGRFFAVLPDEEVGNESMVIKKGLGYWVHGSNGFLHYRNRGFL